jgi:hypothetical protein
MPDEKTPLPVPAEDLAELIRGFLRNLLAGAVMEFYEDPDEGFETVEEAQAWYRGARATVEWLGWDWDEFVTEWSEPRQHEAVRILIEEGRWPHG